MAVAPKPMLVEPTVTALAVKELGAILERVFDEPEMVLFVKVCDSDIPARVSVPFGRVNVPVALATGMRYWALVVPYVYQVIADG